MGFQTIKLFLNVLKNFKKFIMKLSLIKFMYVNYLLGMS